MQWRKQLEFIFQPFVAATSLREVHRRFKSEGGPQGRGYTREAALESEARRLLRALGAEKLAREIRVEWNPRLKTCAGRADYREKLISLNPLLQKHADEVDRTLRHELAHLLAQWRIGRRRIAPHGIEWRQACVDLGIGDEARCHDLPFTAKTTRPPYIYFGRNAKEKFPRVRRIPPAMQGLACCRNTTAVTSI